MKGLQEIPAPETQEETDATRVPTCSSNPIGLSEEELALIAWLGDGGAVRPED